MGRRSPIVVLIALIATLGACSNDGVGFCAAAPVPLPRLDAEDSVARWRVLEAAADEGIRGDVEGLRVIAEQIERLGPEAPFESVAAIAVRAEVAQSLARVTAHQRAVCGRRPQAGVRTVAMGEA